MTDDSQKGFTLVELIVVIAVIGLLSSLLLANYRTSSRSSELQYTAQKLIGDLRKVQNMAISSYKYQEEAGGIEEVPCGYGLHFRADNSYVLYRDLSPDDLDKECLKSDKIYNYGEAIGQPINLPERIDLEIEVDDIFFMPPSAKIFFNGQDGLSLVENEILIKLSESGNPKNKKIIRVNNFGLISLVGE
jgi:prepilin-type N-terminal cleavage/methylation domain-containing protein